MTKKERAHAVTELLKTVYPDAVCALHYTHDYELLFATRLSAQCTDARVNIVTATLFHQFPTLESFAQASEEDIAEVIKTCGLFRTKARDLKACAIMLLIEFGGNVPDNMADLLRLPGVGRKTANVIQSVVFNKAAMAVDTHVFRVSHRIGLVDDTHTTPFSVEKELVKYIPKKLIPIAHHWLILHGRYICQARTPKCDNCGLQLMCKYFQEAKIK
mgnify:CR=1 FL=1